MLTQIDAIYGVEVGAPLWEIPVTYYVPQQVSWNGVIYEALRSNTNKQPDISPLDWQLAEKALALPILGVNTTDSLLLRKVTGLNPPDVDLFIGEFSRDGGYYQGRRVGDRNVVLTIDLNPNPALGETVSGLRELLYKTFVDPLVDNDYVELVLREDDGRIRNLYGYCEKFETEIFDVETMVQISMICPDPYIRDLAETVLTNPTGSWITVPFTYNGTAETGFYVEIEVTNATNMVTLKNNNSALKLSYPFQAGDQIRLNTKRGERDITLVRNFQLYPLIASLTSDSKWLEVHSQNNYMTVYGADTSALVAGVKTLRFRSSYWGV